MSKKTNDTTKTEKAFDEQLSARFDSFDAARISRGVRLVIDKNLEELDDEIKLLALQIEKHCEENMSSLLAAGRCLNMLRILDQCKKEYAYVKKFLDTTDW